MVLMQRGQPAVWSLQESMAGLTECHADMAVRRGCWQGG